MSLSPFCAILFLTTFQSKKDNTAFLTTHFLQGDRGQNNVGFVMKEAGGKKNFFI